MTNSKLKTQHSTLVLKIGGNDIDDPEFLGELVGIVATMRPLPVLVHGGGKEIGQLQVALGGEPQFVGGLRVTDKIALRAAEMVLCGTVSTRLVAALVQAGIDAQGLSGVDRGLIRARKATHADGDLGFVGTPTAVRGEILAELLHAGVIPVVAPISLGPDGTYNVNADEAAGAIAEALDDAEVVFVTNVPGVLVDGIVAEQLDRQQVLELIDGGVITGGMIPKVRSALAALDVGVESARITNLAGLESGAGTVVSG